MLDPDAPPRSPEIAAALGPVRMAVRGCRGRAVGPLRLLVACSGGPDSIAALGLLTLLCRSEELELCVGHVDHGLRSESAEEAALVESLAGALSYRCQVTRLELGEGPGLPARARAARRAALEAQRVAAGAQWIVLGHTATDQAETMMMHIERGAGLDGLAAMCTTERPWLRPLLELTRAQTRALCGQLELPFVDDPTNADIEASRIFLREVVLPHMRGNNPRIEHALLGLARQAADAERALGEWAERELGERGLGARLGLEGFDALPRAVRTRVLRRSCERGGADLAHLRHQVVDAMDEAAVAVAVSLGAGPGARRPAPRRWDLHPRCHVLIDKRGVLVEASDVPDQVGRGQNH